MLPELRSERRWRREMRKLCSNALKEEPRQALPVDHRDTRRRNPSDESKSDHIQISPQPISLKAFKPRNRTTKSSISKSNPKPINSYTISHSNLTYQVILPPNERATPNGFLATTGGLTNSAKTRKNAKIN